MLGDNRDNSTDSRILSQMGYIPLENIIGRAGLIYFSRSSTGAIRTARITTGRFVATPRRRRGQSMSVLGTFRTSPSRCVMSVSWGRADFIFKHAEVRV